MAACALAISFSLLWLIGLAGGFSESFLATPSLSLEILRFPGAFFAVFALRSIGVSFFFCKSFLFLFTGSGVFKFFFGGRLSFLRLILLDDSVDQIVHFLGQGSFAFCEDVGS